MKTPETWLIVGGDGLIGRRLAGDARRFTAAVVASSRRPETKSGQVFADLATGDTQAAIAVAPHVAFLCAALTNMKTCQAEPELSWRVNVTETVKLAAQLMERGSFVVFLSSNTVFDGTTPWPPENTPYAADTEYGRQKVAAEQQLLQLPGANERLAIVRLSKVLSAESGMAAEFTARLRAGQRCRAFSDLLMSPVSLTYVVEALLKIANKRCPGIYNLSGTEELSYAAFAQKLASHLGADQSLVDVVRSVEVGIEVLFKPQYPGLGMPHTAATLGITPEPVDHVLRELFSVNKSNL